MSLIALSITSCTSDDVQNGDTNANIEKTSVSLSVDATSSSKTAKDVNRGTIYAWVKDINVIATSTIWNYSKSESYTLVASGGASNFTISDVAVGANRFDATTTSFDANKVYAVSSINPSGNTTALAAAQTAINVIKTHSPYAVYGGTANATITNDVSNTVNLSLNTTNGRVIAAFVLDNDILLRSNTYAIVTSSISGVSNSTLTSAQIKNNVVTFEWSNENSIVGKTITFTVNVYDDTAPNRILKTYTITKDIQASTSYSCIYTIDRDKIINSKEDKLTFTFQVWNEVNCESDYDNDGYNCNGRDRNGRNRQGFNKCGWHEGNGNGQNPFYNANQDENTANGSGNECGS